MALQTKNKPVQPTALSNHGLFGVRFFKAHLMMDSRWKPKSLSNQYAFMTNVLESYSEMALQTKNKPVQPTALSNHGLFGVRFFKAHLMMDSRWKPKSLSNQYAFMTNVLEKHFEYSKHKKAAFKKQYLKQNKILRHQCRSGRIKLSMALHGTNSKKIRNYLLNYKDMQRLYQAMPIHLVVDNINQKTFVLRKERDRLRYTLKQLVVIYEHKLCEQAALENQIKYESGSILEEEIQSKKIRNKIECSDVRLNAIKTLNDAYKKIIQLLLQDEIYYEPILRSLQKDIDDQNQFTNYIIELGLPAIGHLEEIIESCRKLEKKARRNYTAKLQWVQQHKKQSAAQQEDLRKLQAQGAEPTNYLQRYVQETPSMMECKNELDAIDLIIKRVKFATLCSKATEVYPRIKKQIENNQLLKKILDGVVIVNTFLERRLKRADVMRGILQHNLSKEGIERLNKIQELSASVAKAKDVETQTRIYLRGRAKIFLMMRFVFWNFNEILRHIIRGKRVARNWPNLYLKLPLLKFENLVTKAYPPKAYDEDLDTLLSNFKKKVQVLMGSFKDSSKKDSEKFQAEYHQSYCKWLDTQELPPMATYIGTGVVEEDDYKLNLSVPSRKQIKQLSAKLVEELSYKDE